MNSNYYIAKVFARKCIIDIRVNDIPLIRENVQGDINFERPINYLIEKTGMQLLTVRLLPPMSEDCELNIEIWKYDASGRKLSSIDKVAALRYDSSESHVSIIPVKKQTFLAEVDYEIARWSRCEVISSKFDIKPMVVSFMKTLTDVLLTKQFDQYARMIGQRERDICHSLYLGEDEVRKRMDMLKDCLDNGFEYFPIKGQKTLQYYGGRRVVSVVGEDNKSALKFYRCDTREMLTLELLLGIPVGSDKLSII